VVLVPDILESPPFDKRPDGGRHGRNGKSQRLGISNELIEKLEIERLEKLRGMGRRLSSLRYFRLKFFSDAPPKYS
jgi:hypothetical protein